MKISFTTVPANIGTHNGYGIAGYNVSSALQRLGHEVPFQDETAPVEIAFSQPIYDSWSSNRQYRIQYTPWESTELPAGWLEGFNKADEVWTPSPLIAQWYKDAGVTQPIKVYEHGIEQIWFGALHQRKREDGPFVFLHHGEPAFRKGGQEALNAFRAVFGNSTDVHLLFKSWGHSRVRAMEDGENIGAPDEVYDNVSIIRTDVPEINLVSLYKHAHAMVYPGWGEGFGLIPLQGMAAGLPTICTEAWAPYKDLLLPDLRLDSTLTDSPWQNVHPGKMFKPDFKNLCEIMKHTYENYDELAGQAYRKAFAVAERYNWDRLTEEAFADITRKFT